METARETRLGPAVGWAAAGFPCHHGVMGDRETLWTSIGWSPRCGTVSQWPSWLEVHVTMVGVLATQCLLSGIYPHTLSSFFPHVGGILGGCGAS